MVKEHLVTPKNLDLALELYRSIFPKENPNNTCFEESGAPDFHYCIVYDSTVDQPMGFPVGIRGLYTEKADPESAFLGWFGVLEQFRRQRYGTRILNFFEEDAKANGYKYARIYTGETNEVARRFYEFAGYTCETLDYDTTDYAGEQVVIYSKTLCDDPVPPWNNRKLEF